jgi:hypothetical protein
MFQGVIFSNTVWTFWDVWVLLIFVLPLVLLSGFALYDVVRRSDLPWWAVVGWLLIIIIVPLLGGLAYLGFKAMREIDANTRARLERARETTSQKPLEPR